MAITEASVIDENITHWKVAPTPLSDEQREKNLTRVLAQSDRLISVSRERIDAALDVITPKQSETKPETVSHIDEIVEPAMTTQEAVTTLSAWAHMGDGLRETVYNSQHGTIVTFVRNETAPKEANAK